MAYVVPQVKVFQEFTQAPSVIVDPLRAFVIGPNYFTSRYEDGDGLLGQYDPTLDEEFAWPNRPAGAVVDQSFTKVHVKDALLRYYSNLAGDTADEIRALTGYTNRIRAEAVNFKANGDDWPLSDGFNNRDVQIDDVVRVYANVNGTLHELWTRITGIVADLSTPEVASAATADVDNVSAESASGAGGADLDNTGARDIDDGSIAGYDGLADGFVSESYTIEITTASIGGVGALARVTSDSGTDDDTDVPITASGQSIGTRGLTFDWSGSGEWEVGDVFTVSASQDYTAPSVTGGGEFDSDRDTTYIITVTKGGQDGVAEISISTTNGLDISGPHVVDEDAGISIGTKGAEITFNVTGALQLIKGERWYLACTGRTSEGYKTLVLADSLPAAIRAPYVLTGLGDSSSSSVGAPNDVNLQLFVRRTIQLPRENFPDAPAVNWSQGATQISIKADAKVYQSDFVDSDGNLVALAIDADSDGLYSQVYVTYRALVQTYASGIDALSSIADVEDALGEVSVDNPLALGVWYALRNSNGTPVRFMAVPTNDLDGYSLALDKASGRRDLYTIVPMTRDAQILSAIAAHVDASSSADNNQWRIAFFNSLSSSLEALIDVGENYPLGGTSTYEEDDLIANVTADPDTSETQYTIVEWDDAAYTPSGGFVDMGARAGDIFRTNYQGDGFGNETYEDYVIDAVISNQILRLVSGPASSINVARKFSLHRSLTRSEEAIAYGEKSAVFANRRIYHVWPDVIENESGVQIDGVYLCAAIAGLISGVVPQQGLTNVAIEGFSEVSRTTEYFSFSQLNEMAERGTWIVAQDHASGTIYTRHQLSTNMTSVDTRELSITKSIDAISFVYYSALAPYIGRANITPRFLQQLDREIRGTADFLKARGATPTLGGLLIEAELLELRQDEVNLDHVVVGLRITPPRPANVIELHLVI